MLEPIEKLTKDIRSAARDEILAATTQGNAE